MGRSKKKKATTRRTSRVGARKSKTDGSKVLGMLALGVVGGVAVKLAGDKLAPGMKPVIKGAIQVALGGGVAYFGKSPLAIGAGIGMAVVGGETLFRSFGVISGPTYYVPRPLQLAGPRNITQSVAGNGITQTVAGNGIKQSVAGRYNRYAYGA